jgi:hypothetical protein
VRLIVPALRSPQRSGLPAGCGSCRKCHLSKHSKRCQMRCTLVSSMLCVGCSAGHKSACHSWLQRLRAHQLTKQASQHASQPDRPDL